MRLGMLGLRDHLQMTILLTGTTLIALFFRNSRMAFGFRFDCFHLCFKAVLSLQLILRMLLQAKKVHLQAVLVN